MGQKESQDNRSHADDSADAVVLSKQLLSNTGTNQEIITAATARKEKMKILAKDPENFLLNVIPQDSKNKLPIVAQDQIEKRVEITGLLYEDVTEEGKDDDVAPNSAILQTVDSEGNTTNSYQVYLRDGMKKEYSGKVKVTGYLLDNVLVPITIENASNVLGVNTTGNIKIAVVMVNFKKDMSDTKNQFTPQQLAAIYFTDPTNSVANYINDTSLGKLTVIGDLTDVYGWLTLSGYTRNQVCDIYERDPDNAGFIKAINQLAKQQATARGKVFGDYNIIGYIFPTVPEVTKNAAGTNCYWNAITKGIPGDTIVSPIHFLNGDYDSVNDVDHGDLDSTSAKKFYSGILAHEVGHSLGLSHANGITCGSKQIAAYSNCTIYNYGDRFDLIGGAWDYHAHTNARNKIMEGWLPAANMKTVSKDGTYTLYSSSKDRTDQTQLIKIDRPVDSGNYYIEYRSKNNGDSGMPDYIYSGAMIRLSDVDLPPMKNEYGNIQDEWRTKQSYLLDVNKSDNSGRGGLLNPVFKDGMVFDDARNDITIQQISHDTDSVKLSIKFNVPPCVINNPVISVTEPSLSGQPGEKVSYSFSITNKNSSSCPNSTYNLSASSPSGWIIELSKTSVTLSSGSSISFTVGVTSAQNASAINNPFSITVTVQDKNNSTSKASKEIRYSVEDVNQQIPSSTSTPTLSPTPTKKPTSTLTPSPTPIPATTIPTITNIPNSATTLHFSNIKLHGIGNGGDSLNPNTKGNPDPKRKTRVLTVELYDSAGQIVTSSQGNINYSASTGDFNGTITLPASFVTGDYRIKIKTDLYLKKQLPNVITITKDLANEIPGVGTDLTAGDTNLDGILDNQDYYVISDCYSELLPAKNCNDASKKLNADISDDGKVNNDDYGLYIRERSVQK